MKRFPTARRRATRPLRLPLLACTVAMLSGCTGGNAARDPHLLAQGKDFEVTIPELDQLLRAAPHVERDKIAPVRRMLLERLVDEKLLAEAAVAEKLDREVATMQAIEAARRQILARAYAERIAAGASQPSVAEIDAAFHRENASGRVRALLVDELTVPTDAPALKDFAGAFDHGGLDALAARLDAARLPAKPGRTRLAAEDLPGVGADRLAALAIGDQVVFRIGETAHFGRVAMIERAPEAPAAARAAIAERLLSARRAALVQQAIGRLRTERAVVVKDPAAVQVP